MSKKIFLLTILLFALFGFVHSVSAYGFFDLGTQYNPLYVQPVLTDSQKNEQKIFQLQMIYGAEAYQKCAPSAGYSLLPPEFQTSQLLQTESCLIQSVKKQSLTPSQPQCLLGYILQNGSCVTPAQICANKYGSSYTWNGKIENGVYKCECKLGYVWDVVKNDCAISAPVPVPSSPSPSSVVPSCPSNQFLSGSQCLTYDQGCKNAYGSLSVWTGSFDQEKHFLCDCLPGYSWDDKDQCAEPKSNPVIQEKQTLENILSQETALTKPNKATAAKYKGRLLVQTMPDSQEIRVWYVNPKNLKRYYLQSDAEILAALQKMAKFVTPAQFKQLQKKPKSLLGYFVVVTNEGGHYFGNIPDKKLYKIQEFSASQALTALVKAVGTSITDGELRKIGVGELKR